MTRPAENRLDLPKLRRRLWLAVPLAVVLLIGLFLYRGLSLSPKDIPSALIDKPVPEFVMAGLPGRGTGKEQGFKSQDLKGRISLVNIFASWCVPCRAEHPVLMEIAAKHGVAIHGINYKEDPKSGLAWLQRFGDPYDKIGVDREGRVSIDFGVYGVPETFLIDAKGRIRCKHLGAIDLERDWRGKLLPAIEALKAGKPVVC